MLLVAAPSAQTQMMPPTVGDPRIQTFVYDSRQIYPLEVASSYTLMIGLAPGERVETLAVGDSNAWQVSANKRGDAIFIKRNYSGVNTNLTVITDARTYVFELLGNRGSTGVLPLIIRFTYPRPAPAIEQPRPVVQAVAYRVTGERSLRPAEIKVTATGVALGWPPGVQVPAVFQINEDGSESLVNSIFVDDRMLIQGVPRALVFRSGRLRASAKRILPREARR